MKEVAEAAAPFWKNLTAEEKGPYEARAKEEKMKQKMHGERYTSLGIPLSQVQREEDEKKNKALKQRETIDKILEEAVNEKRK